MKNTYSVSEIIQMAINIEREGFEFYSKVASHTVSEASKQIFVILAEQEKKHIEIFMSLLAAMSTVYKTDGDYIFDEHISRYFKALTENKVFSPSRVYDASDMTSANGAIHEGINAEKNSVLFYTELLKTTTNAEVKSSLELIIEEEKSHIAKLTSLLKTV